MAVAVTASPEQAPIPPAGLPSTHTPAIPAAFPEALESFGKGWPARARSDRASRRPPPLREASARPLASWGARSPGSGGSPRPLPGPSAPTL